MGKALSAICLVLLICVGGSAWAKPKLAILGLEVAPGPTGVVEPAMTQVAKDITRELRLRAQSGASPYVVAPNSSKELTDEKLLMSCDNEAKDCMAAIGAGLSADALLYGRVERRGDVYRISLKLLDVKDKTIEPGGDEMVVGSSVVAVTKRLYSKLIGDAPNVAGSLILSARSQSGAAVDGALVMVDEDRKGALAGGRLTVTGLAEGRHVIAIEGSAIQRFEATVTVRSGEQSTLDALLLDRVVTTLPPRSHAFVWKASLGVGIAVMLAGAGYSAYSYSRQQTWLEDKHLVLVGPDTTASISSSNCDQDYQSILTKEKVSSFKEGALARACSWNKKIYVGFVIGGVGLVGAVTSLIMLTRDSGSEEQPPPTGARVKKPDVAIVPILTPDVAGASLSVRW
jgi:hypothetical protein